MERYTTLDVARVSVVFDERDDVSNADSSDGFEPTAAIEIEHDDGTVDAINVGPDGASVLHEMAMTDQFEIDVEDRP